MSLKSYHQKRNFKKTPEPKGKIKSTKGSNLYVIQKHAASHLHYDFRLELDGVLKSWAIPKGPSLDPNVKRLAVQVEDHPLEYGTFEGSIAKGQYGAGTVMLWDKGTWSSDTDLKKDYQKGGLTFSLQGKKLKGAWKLIRIKSDPKNWLLIKVQDKYARCTDDSEITQRKTRSILSNKTIEQLSKYYGNDTKKVTTAKKNKKNLIYKKPTTVNKTIKQEMPHLIKPQLATLVDKPPAGNNWLHEIKFDGYRLLAFIENGKARLMTRGNQNWTAKFPNISKELDKLGLKNAIFDGEVVVLDKRQHPNFQLLQNAIKDNKNSLFIYYIFDLIYFEGRDLSSLPLIERKKILYNVIKSKNNILRYSDHVLGSGEKVFKKSCKLSLEGIVSKDINSTYLQKRTHNWLKVKCTKRQEFVIGGYTLPKGKREGFGSLILGIYSKNKKLIYCGHVGTGFNQKSLQSIFKLLKKHETIKMPFEKKPPESKNALWIKPVLVAEVEFSEWTTDRILRHPSFKGMRNDKSPKNIGLEQSISVQNVSSKDLNKNIEINDEHITHPEKVLYPEQDITKLQLFEYYNKVKKWMLPYIINRPLTLVRCPNGYTKQCFYQKHIDKSISSPLKSILIKEKNGKKQYTYLDDEEGLLSLPQLNTLEIHTWGSSINNIEKPDILVFDLDPAPDVKWKEVVAAAFDVKKQLQKLKLKSFVKTTGGKGLHIVVPIKPEYDWDDIKVFTQTFVKYLVQENPEKYIGTMTKSKRVGKIFIDYLRNLRGATFIAPYSTRARANATVSTPIHWEELTTNIKDTSFTIKTIMKRLQKMKRDPWKNFFETKQSLKLDKLK